MTEKDSRASGLVQEIKATFSHRLRAQISSNGISASQLAKASSISRSVLSGYLGQDPALPNAVNLVRLARALNCDPGILLPNLAPGAIGDTMSEMTQLSNAMTLDNRMRKMLDVIASSPGEFIYYVPSTIPEPLKTPALFEFEDAASGSEARQAYLRAMHSMQARALNGGLLIDEVVLIDLMHQRGTYQGLAPAAAVEQLNVLLTFSQERFPQWQVKVIQRLEARVNVCLLVGKSLLLQEFFDYIIRFTNSELIAQVHERINATFREGTDFIIWHEMHSRSSRGEEVSDVSTHGTV